MAIFTLLLNVIIHFLETKRYEFEIFHRTYVLLKKELNLRHSKKLNILHLVSLSQRFHTPTFRARFLAAVPATESSLLLSLSKNSKSRNNLPNQKDDNDTSPEVFF